MKRSSERNRNNVGSALKELLLGGEHNPQTINLAIKRILEDHNSDEILLARREKRGPVIIPSSSCHCLRHTFCTRFVENESNIKVIQAIMGHANYETALDIYTEVTESRKGQEMVELAKKMKNE